MKPIHKTKENRIAIWTMAKCGVVVTKERISRCWNKVTCKKCLKFKETK